MGEKSESELMFGVSLELWALQKKIFGHTITNLVNYLQNNLPYLLVFLKEKKMICSPPSPNTKKQEHRCEINGAEQQSECSVNHIYITTIKGKTALAVRLSLLIRNWSLEAAALI